ncbi:Transcriptional repressor NrdR [Candidatus Anstonella stagnisolia]|nr:Transcriptional repressor NrdR [Candidatus Anstonella stagnisolia]
MPAHTGTYDWKVICLKCPYCSYWNTLVLDSRESSDFQVRRRRKCTRCKKRFTTYEEAQTMDLSVIKKDGRREKFDRHKILAGLERACEKRPVSAETIERLADSVEAEVRKLDSIDVPSRKIGAILLKKLKKTDLIAYLRFASVYLNFDDLSAFDKALKELKKKQQAAKKQHQ